MKLSVIIPVYNQEELVIKALNSIPKTDNIEIIVVDDASTDNTWNNLMNYDKENKYNIVYLFNETNKGVGYTVNKGIDMAIGEYIVLLGSDDYFYTNELKKALKRLDGTDLIYFNLRVNNGDIWVVDNESKWKFGGSVKFMRREFIGDTRCPEIRYAEDAAFYKKLMEKNPTEKFLNTVIKHYNHPREGSLCFINVSKEDKC